MHPGPMENGDNLADTCTTPAAKWDCIFAGPRELLAFPSSHSVDFGRSDLGNN